MPRVLIFLGAGASKGFADIPTMEEMVPLFKQELEGEPEAAKLYFDVFSALEEAYPDRVDLEAVFSALSGIANARTLKDLGFHAAYEAKRLRVLSASAPSPETQCLAQNLLKKFENFVTSRCEIKPDAEKNLLKLYSRFSNQLPERSKSKKLTDGELWYSDGHAVYTTNYDLCIETICRRAGVEINKGSIYDREHDIRVLKVEELVGDKFKIVKLHGSLSWYRRQDGLMVEYPEGTPTRGTEAAQISERVMLYPIEEKAMYEEPYIILVNHFRRDLKAAPYWLFIGYRFNDPFLLRIIEYCSNDEKRIGVFHSEAESLVEKKLANVHGTKMAFRGRFGDNPDLNRISSLFV